MFSAWEPKLNMCGTMTWNGRALTWRRQSLSCLGNDKRNHSSSEKKRERKNKWFSGAERRRPQKCVKWNLLPSFNRDDSDKYRTNRQCDPLLHGGVRSECCRTGCKQNILLLSVPRFPPPHFLFSDWHDDGNSKWTKTHTNTKEKVTCKSSSKQPQVLSSLFPSVLPLFGSMLLLKRGCLWTVSLAHRVSYYGRFESKKTWKGGEEKARMKRRRKRHQ